MNDESRCKAQKKSSILPAIIIKTKQWEKITQKEKKGGGGKRQSRPKKKESVHGLCTEESLLLSI